MTLLEKIQMSSMEFVYIFYLQLMEVDAPYRMAIIIVAFGIITPYALLLLLLIIKKIVKGPTALLDSSHYKLGALVLNRRKKGKNPIIGTGLIEALLSIFLFVFTKLNDFLTRKRHYPNTRKRYISLLVACAIMLPSWGILRPENAVGRTWSKFEADLIQQHLIKLGYKPGTYKSFADFAAKIAPLSEKTTSATPQTRSNEIYLTPMSNAKKGVYLRKGPNTSAVPLDVLAYGEKALFLGEKSVSSSGVTWYKIQTNRKIIGWVSSKVTVEATQ